MDCEFIAASSTYQIVKLPTIHHNIKQKCFSGISKGKNIQFYAFT